MDFTNKKKKASKDVQDQRYEHFNTRRLKSFEEAKKVRQNIIDGVEKNSDIIGEKNEDGNKNEGLAQGTQEELIKKELEKLEMLKKQ